MSILQCKRQSLISKLCLKRYLISKALDLKQILTKHKDKKAENHKAKKAMPQDSILSMMQSLDAYSKNQLKYKKILLEKPNLTKEK